MNLNNFWMAFECLTIPLFDCFHYICFCFGKKFRCDICNKRFKHKLHMAEHIRHSHSEIFVFVDTLHDVNTMDILSINSRIKNNKIN
jgi:hypothetical protein